MNRHARRAITFTATATDRGRVEFDVDQVGIFTVAFGSNGYPHDCNTERFEVVYGRWTDHILFGRAQELPSTPGVVNGIGLVGGSVFDPDQTLAHLRESEHDWCGWLTVFRRNDSWSEQVPWKTKERVAYIVARLVEAFPERDDVDELGPPGAVDPVPSRSDRPRWRDYSTAATRDGETFLISTVGTRRPE